MHKFSDFGIKPKVTSFVGEKIAISRLFNLEIKVIDFKIEPSKQKEGSELLTMQIEKSGEKRIVFTGSTILIQMIKKVPDDGFPFKTIIKGDNEYYEFT